MTLMTTQRLTLRKLRPEDATFIVALLNEPAFHQYIGDKGVRDEAGALSYLQNGPMASYKKHGFGLYLVIENSSQKPIGICGLKQRTGLDMPDLGYAFIKESWGNGYATEAGKAIVDYARSHLKLETLLAVTHPKNNGSIKVLEKIGFHYRDMITLDGFEEPSKLFEIDLN